jgi:sugar/nucleoside kinase (ribokinase family)
VRQLVVRNPAWVYYGTLFPSSPRARCVVRQLLAAAPNATRFYDMNLRPGFESPELIRELLEQADVVKLNERELQFVHDHLELPLAPEAFCRAGSKRYGWTAACVTFGSRAARCLSVTTTSPPWRAVDVADPVGAGDAFAAAFVHGLASAMDGGTHSRIRESRRRQRRRHPRRDPGRRAGSAAAMINQPQLIAYVDRLTGGTFRDLRHSSTVRSKTRSAAFTCCPSSIRSTEPTPDSIRSTTRRWTPASAPGPTSKHSRREPP